jgi:hypothetical protein
VRRGSHKIDEKNLPPEHLELASAMLALRRGLTRPRPMPSLADISERLRKAGHPASISSISKYVRVKDIPPARFVEELYRLARADTGPSCGLLTIDELLDLRDKAEAEGCRGCLRHLRARRTAPTGDSLTSAKSAHLPVPRPDRDRQRIDSIYPAAAIVADESVKHLADGRHEAALAILSEVPERLTPAESAACLVLLRRQEQQLLAETLIQVYGREQQDKDVMRLAVELHAYGHVDDADKALRAAVS